MGTNASQLEKEIGTDQFPANEHYFGLINYGNTCYINSVLQALYFCKPFRDKILEYKAKNKRTKESLLACLADLFYNIATQKKKHDAHEFFVQLIDSINETILERQQQGRSYGIRVNGMENCHASEGRDHQPSCQVGGTWVHEIFQAIVTRRLKCLNCEAVRSTDEVLNNLSVEVYQNTSITHCLRCYFSTETISAENKVHCDNCCSLQEHQKLTRIKKLPTILVLHLKRFQFLGQYNRPLKLSYRVVFPLELRLIDMSEEVINPDRLYDLVAVVVHAGTGINRGHYFAIVKSHCFWLLFDDDVVDKVDPNLMEDFYGLTSEIQKSSETGYILFYQARDPT